jgi:hypothetical protein
MMRYIVSTAALAVGVCVLFGAVAESKAQLPRTLGEQKASPIQHVQGGESCGEQGCCDKCGGRCKRGRCGSRGSNDAANFNCNCNGSYKFPVPPLSTYHWPGMYSIQLMTDYQSPWRFPPLRPYTDEPSFEGEARKVSYSSDNSISFKQPKTSKSRGVESMSAKIQRMYGTK